MGAFDELKIRLEQLQKEKKLKENSVGERKKGYFYERNQIGSVHLPEESITDVVDILRKDEEKTFAKIGGCMISDQVPIETILKVAFKTTAPPGPPATGKFQTILREVKNYLQSPPKSRRRLTQMHYNSLATGQELVLQGKHDEESTTLSTAVMRFFAKYGISNLIPSGNGECQPPPPKWSEGVKPEKYYEIKNDGYSIDGVDKHQLSFMALRTNQVALRGTNRYTFDDNDEEEIIFIKAPRIKWGSNSNSSGTESDCELATENITSEENLVTAPESFISTTVSTRTSDFVTNSFEEIHNSIAKTNVLQNDEYPVPLSLPRPPNTPLSFPDWLDDSEDDDVLFAAANLTNGDREHAEVLDSIKKFLNAFGEYVDEEHVALALHLWNNFNIEEFKNALEEVLVKRKKSSF